MYIIYIYIYILYHAIELIYYIFTKLFVLILIIFTVVYVDEALCLFTNVILEPFFSFSFFLITIY